MKVSNKKQKSTETKKVKAGLGGWLIVVGLGLILLAILGPISILGYISSFITPVAIPGFAIVNQIELVMQFLYVIFNFYLLYLFFKKNKKFPKYYIIFLYSLIAWSIIDYFMVASLSASTAELKSFLNDFLQDTTKEVVKTIISSFIWILYMHKSKRVKATFVNA